MWTEAAFSQSSFFVSTVLLHKSWILSSYLFSFSEVLFFLSYVVCATMQHLITSAINTSMQTPGSWGSSRNSRCLLLLLTSASTAVKLDHCDANLRRCCNPGEEPGSVRLIKREEASKSEARRRETENDEYMSNAGRETDRDPCLGVNVSTVMMKQSPPCYDNWSTVWLRSIFTESLPQTPCWEKIWRLLVIANASMPLSEW